MDGRPLERVLLSHIASCVTVRRSYRPIPCRLGYLVDCYPDLLRKLSIENNRQQSDSISDFFTSVVSSLSCYDVREMGKGFSCKKGGVCSDHFIIPYLFHFPYFIPSFLFFFDSCSEV
jgi:hypothetical protein